MMQKRSFLCIAGVGLFFCTSLKAREKPNFVFIIADDVSWDDFGCYGNRNVKTPNIDRLASQGMRFTNFFLTASSCSPSRNSIITGRYPHNTGAAELHTEPPTEMISFPEVLRQQGYYTAQTGKFHMGKYALRGFDFTDQSKINGDGGEELWVETLRRRPSKKPFFMWFAAFDAHRDWGPNSFSGTHDPTILTPPFYLANGEKTKVDLAKYYDEIARFDHFVGMVVEELKRQNVLDNTVLLIIADNGRAFPHSKTRVNDRGMKSPFIVSWPKGISLKDKLCSSLISAIDIAPTLLDLASSKIPETIQGVSFKALLKNPAKSFRNFVFAEHNWHDYEAHERMARSKDFLYILNSRPKFTNIGPADAAGSQSFEDLEEQYRAGSLSDAQAEIFLCPRPSEELYNNKADDAQIKNLAFDIAYTGKLVEFREILKNWMDETGDNIPQNLTSDWYEKRRGYLKTKLHGIRGENPGDKSNAIKNINKGRF